MVAEGHTVRGTVRNVAEAGEFVKALGAEVCEVKDLGDKAALQKAFEGVDGVYHMAAVHPEYGFAATPEGREGILKTAVDGTLAVLEAAKSAGVSRVVLTSSLAAIESGNSASIRLHERLGFVTTGQMPQVGRKFGRWLDLTFMQLTLE